MKIAYILDSSAISKSNDNDVFVIPFRTYDPNGAIIKAYDHNLVTKLTDTKTDSSKSFIEPTPGMYRDLYLTLKTQGYDHIIVIPQKKTKSISYKNASYACNITKMDVNIIDASELNASPKDILDLLLTDTKASETIHSVTFDFSTLINILIKAFNSLSLNLN